MPMGVSIPVRAINMVRACAYIHGVGFCIAYSTTKVFLVPQKADKQIKRSAFFISILFSLSILKDNRSRHCLLFLHKIKDLVIIVPYECTDKNRTITGPWPDDDLKKYGSEQ